MVAEENHPLAFHVEAWKDLDRKGKTKARGIEEYDLSFIAGEPMFRNGIVNKRFHFEAIPELKKFLSIKIIADPHPLGMFSPIIAAAWHCFILNTIKYEEFCKKFYGKLIHHVPGGGAGLDNRVWIAIYKEWFGDFPTIWMLDIGGTEIPGYRHSLNVDGVLPSMDCDSDDGAYGG